MADKGTPTQQQIDEALAQLRGEAPTVSRSDALAAHLLATDKGPARVAAVLEAMLTATTTVDVWHKQGKDWVKAAEIVPDNRTRLQAAREIMKAQGHYFQAQAKPETDPLAIAISLLPEEGKRAMLKLIAKYFPEVFQNAAPD